MLEYWLAVYLTIAAVGAISLIWFGVFSLMDYLDRKKTGQDNEDE